jgi:hypothetical protein
MLPLSIEQVKSKKSSCAKALEDKVKSVKGVPTGTLVDN